VGVDRFEMQPHLVLADAGEFAQLLEEPRLQLNVTADHRERRSGRSEAFILLQLMDPEENGRERRLQFVRKYCEEAVFAEQRLSQQRPRGGASSVWLGRGLVRGRMLMTTLGEEVSRSLSIVASIGRKEPSKAWWRN
jgi:hypothetical protein